MREPVKPSVDQEVFRRTAAHSKAINIGYRHFRGGTRL